MKQIFVVEGRNDQIKLNQVYPDLIVVSVNGSEVDKKVLDFLISKQNEYEIVLIMDPDYPGLKIRDELESKLKNVSHVFLERNKSFSKNKKKIGFEHLSNEEIIKVLNNIVKPNYLTSDVDLNFLYEHHLIGHKNSKEIRNDLAKKLNIGYVNGKTLLKRLNQFNINKSDILKHL